MSKEKMKVKGLSGLIISSANPERLAKFYKDVMGIPMALNHHGTSPDHWECDYHGIHFAILERKNSEKPSENIVPSFYIDDIEQFIAKNSIKLHEEAMDLGNAFSIGFKDPDENTVRLWMHKK
jgi:predicted enzyme related to lactoylglutathione lyase